MGSPTYYGGSVATLQNAATATGNGTALSVQGATRVTVEVSGTFVGTVTFEGTIDDTTWTAIGLKTAADGAAATTATAPGMFKRTPDLGLSQVRARISAYTSGSITVKALREF